MGSKAYDENSSHQTMTIADRLPELEEDAIQEAAKEHHVEWAEGMLKHYDVGELHVMPGVGITLQIVSEDTARCISVYDHGYPLLMLRMLMATFEHAGLILEVEPHTVLRPYEAPVEREIEQGGGGARDDGNFGIEVV
jgi:hypothetical protein